jgi:hypothetical protein
MAIEPRTIFARIARMSMSGRERHHELLVDVDLALRVANKGFIFALHSIRLSAASPLAVV